MTINCFMAVNLLAALTQVYSAPQTDLTSAAMITRRASETSDGPSVIATRSERVWKEGDPCNEGGVGAFCSFLVTNHG